MVISIKFENEFEKLITSQEVNSVNNFHKVFEENGILKKKEEYKNNIILKVIYYIGPNGNEHQVIAEILSNYSSLIGGFEIRILENIGTYKKEIQKFFSATGIYDNFLITLLFNQENFLIYEMQEDIINGVAHYDVRKYFYDSLLNDEYEFIYNGNGELSVMKGSYPPFVAENDFAISANEITIYFPGFLSNNPYYQNANLLP